MARGGLASVFVVAIGCYNAQPQAGAPCDPAADNCPSGQTCEPSATGHNCTTDPGDAIDAPGFEGGLPDDDGDGTPNIIDNCPTLANPNQENEDFDPRGNACDECPPIASANVVDGDGDGVGDACDPFPMTPGERLVLFEGFDSGIPATWIPNGAWTGAAGLALITATGTNLHTLVIPVTGTANQTLRARTTIVSLSQQTGGSLGVVGRFDDVGDEGVHCGGGKVATAELFGLIDAATGVFIQSASRSMDIGTTYDLTLRSTDESQQCSDATSPPVMVTGNYNSNNKNVGLRSRSAIATFEWVMLVSSD